MRQVAFLLLTFRKKALENDTLMEDLNLNMSTWAKDLLEYFSDATDRKDVYPGQADEIGWAQEGRDKLYVHHFSVRFFSLLVFARWVSLLML